MDDRPRLIMTRFCGKEYYPVAEATWHLFKGDRDENEPDQLWLEIAMDRGVAAAVIWKQIFTEWFPMSGYELAQSPEMEMHYLSVSGKYKAEIWIPVIKP